MSPSLYQLVKEGVIVPQPEPEVPKIPIDYAWAQELGMIRKPANFVSTIVDDRGEELVRRAGVGPHPHRGCRTEG